MVISLRRKDSSTMRASMVRLIKENHMCKTTANNYVSWYTLLLDPGSKLSMNLVARDRVGKQLGFKDMGSTKRDKQPKPHREKWWKPTPTHHHYAGWFGADSVTIVCAKPAHSMRRDAKQTAVGKNYYAGQKCPYRRITMSSRTTIYTCNYGE